MIILILTVSTLSASQNRISIQGKEIFLSGMNVAWNKYANDVGDTPIDKNKFTEVVVNVRSSGGNAIRWWLSTNGVNDPKFDPSTNLVSGLGKETINNIKTVLDICEENGVVVSLCLMSHNYLQDGQGVNITQTKKLLTTDEGLQAYIDNALTPMVSAIGNHPAIACWEIFNEPEGMVDGIGWAAHANGSGFTMEKVQVVVNRCAGAIKRVNDSLLVSNGAHTFTYSSDVASFKNNYSDANLIAAGGDALGTLDFYQVHFYPNHQGDDLSPFHHPASYWGLDKPIVVGEFPNVGCVPIDGKFKVSSELSPVEAYNYLYDNGYAGALSWAYTGHDGFGYFEDVKPALTNLYENHKEDIFIAELSVDTSKGNYAMKLNLDELSESTNKEWISTLYSNDLSSNSKISLDIKIDSVYSGESIAIRFVTKSGNWTWCQASKQVTVPADGEWFNYEIALSDMAGIQTNDMKSILLQIFPSGAKPFSGVVLVDNVMSDKTTISDFNDKFSLWEASADAVALTTISAVPVGNDTEAIKLSNHTNHNEPNFSVQGSRLYLRSLSESAGRLNFYSVSGRLLHSQEFSQGVKEISLTHSLSQGVYFLQMQLGKEQQVIEFTVQ